MNKKTVTVERAALSLSIDRIDGTRPTTEAVKPHITKALQRNTKSA